MTPAEVLRALRRGWWIVLACLIIGAGAGFGLSKILPKRYSSEATVFVTSRLGSALTEQQVKSFANIATSTGVLQGVASKLAEPDAAKRLRGEISVSVPAETTLITLNVTDRNPGRAAVIANVTAQVLGETVEELQRPNLKSSSTVSVKTVRVAERSNTPSSPRTKLNTILGALAGLVVGAGVALGKRARPLGESPSG
jgi:succinoglycan biosynthesis transport protein ExoP